MSKPTGTTTAHAHYPNTDTGGWVVTICRGEQVGRGVSRDIGTAISAAAGDLIDAVMLDAQPETVAIYLKEREAARKAKVMLDAQPETVAPPRQ